MSTSKRDVDATSHSPVFGDTNVDALSDLLDCERTIEVEDLTLGLLSELEATVVREHLASCALCRDALAAFERERSLFTERARQLETSRVAPSTPALVESVEVQVVRSSQRRHAVVRQISQSFVAFAACAATMVFALSGSQVSTSRPAMAEGKPPTLESSSTEVLASFDKPHAMSVSDDGVALACAFPTSAPRANVTAQVDEAPTHGAVCEAPLSSSGSSAWRVTSSYATP